MRNRHFSGIKRAAQRFTVAFLAATIMSAIFPIAAPTPGDSASAAESYPGKSFYVSYVTKSWEANGVLCVVAPISAFSAGHVPENREGAFYCYNDETEMWTPYLESDRSANVQLVFGGDGELYVAYLPSTGPCNATNLFTIARVAEAGSLTTVSTRYNCTWTIGSAVKVGNHIFVSVNGTYNLYNVSLATGSWALITDAGNPIGFALKAPTVIGAKVYLVSDPGVIYVVEGDSISVVTAPAWRDPNGQWGSMLGLFTDGRYLYPVGRIGYFDLGVYRYRWPEARYDTATNQWVQYGGVGSLGWTDNDSYVKSDGHVYMRVARDYFYRLNLVSGTWSSFYIPETYYLRFIIHNERVLAWDYNFFRSFQSLTTTLPGGATYGDLPITVSASSTSGLSPVVTVAPDTVCKLQAGKIAIVGGGTCSVTLSQSGNTMYFAAQNIVKTIAIERAPQTITWSAPASVRVGESLALGGTSSSGGVLSFASLTPNSCGVAGTNLIPFRRGVCRIQASMPATSNYLRAVPVVADIDVNPATQAVGITAPTSMGFGESVEISAQTTSGDPAEWTVLTPDICAIDGSVVTALATGDCTVSASIDASDGYSAASSEATIVVNKGDQAIAFPALPSGLAPGHPITLNATASSGIAVAFQASGACSVGTSSGVTTLTPVGTSGSCTVVARQAGDDNWNAAVPVTRVTTVRKLGQTILFSLTSASRLPSAAPFALAASSTSGLSVAFAARGVCAVSAGTVTLTGSTGVCTITASQAGDLGYRPAVSVSRSFNVAKAIQTIDTSGVEVEWTAPGSTSLPSLSSAGLATSWVSSTEEICVPDYDSDTQSWSVYFVDAGSCELVGSAAGNTDYLAATPVSVTIDITAAAGIGIPGVTVDDGAEYTNELIVTVSLINVPDGTVAVAIGNDGDPTKATQISLDGVVLDGDRYLVPWRLQPTTLDGKLAKTVYVWFLGSDYEAIPYQDGIILDTTAPALTSAVVAKTTGTGPVLGTGANATYGVTLKASDFGSGLAYVQVVTSKTATTNWVGYNAKTKWRGKKGITVYVRVKDVAGNVSSWKTVKLP